MTQPLETIVYSEGVYRYSLRTNLIVHDASKQESAKEKDTKSGIKNKD